MKKWFIFIMSIAGGHFYAFNEMQKDNAAGRAWWTPTKDGCEMGGTGSAGGAKGGLIMRKLLCRCMLAMLLSCGGWLAMAQEAEKPAPQDEKTFVKVEEEVKKEKTPVAKLRGKLLYKKSQIKKLEKAATAADNVLASKLQELENQRRSLLSAAEPRLAVLYAEHDGMEEEIQKMTEKK